MKKYEEMFESSLSRALEHMLVHDCGVISASRYGKGCNPTLDERYTNRENLQRNRQLNAKLQILGYGITPADGAFIENFKAKDKNKKPVFEDVFFVVDLENKGNLKQDLCELGNLYMQDSILWIPTPGDTAYLIGTNHCPDAFPGYKNIQANPVRSFGIEGEFMTMINGRPLKFTPLLEDVYNNYKNTNYLGKMATKQAANEHWRNINI